MDYFPDSPLDDLLAELPAWWAADDPRSEAYKWLAAIASMHTGLDTTAEQLYNDQRLTTASAAGLLAEWAYVYGLRNEINSTMTPDQVRGYVQAWIACDGSTQSILNLLLAIINLQSANLGGAILTFDAGGAGLTFPAGGAGLTLYQYTTKPDQTVGFVFRADGSGITFPDQALYFPLDGSGLALGTTFPNVPDLTFPNSAWVVIAEDFQHYASTVTVKSYLAFDRPAFKRAVDRFRQAHTTSSYAETNT